MEAKIPFTIEPDNINKEENKEDKIIEKWKDLQEIILEEKSLMDALFNYKKEDYSQIKNMIIDYSETKLKIRQMNLKIKRKNKEKVYQIDTKIHQLNSSLYKNIQKFLFFLREHLDYVLKIVLSINESDENYDFNVESLVELICNQFYDNMPEKNKYKQLMIIIYILLEKEICSMDYAMIDSFLDSSYFLEKFLETFCKKEEFTKYLSILLNPLLSDLEKEIDEKDYLNNLSLFQIKDYINDKNNKKENDNKNKIDNKELIHIIWKNFEAFVDDLTQKKLYNLIKKESSKENKEIYWIFYEKSFYNINNGEQNIFSSNNKLIEVLNNDCFNDNIELIINKYKENYLFIHQKIDFFLLNLIDHIKLIPNNIRYICKIIFIFISKKFPNLPKYIRNSFIGKFFFNKYVFPSLIFENKLVFKNKIISLEVKKCIGEIISILSYANKCILYNNNDDIEKATYNNYIIQIIPILDKFYSNLIDIKLPKYIDNLIKLKIEKLEAESKIKKKSRRKINIEVENIMNNNNNSIYKIENLANIRLIKDKKKVNKKNKNNSIEDSLWKLEFILFSINDLVYIISLINKNQNIFIDLPKHDIFYNMFQSFMSKKYELESMIKEKDTQKFYIIYNIPLIRLYENIKNKRDENLLIFSEDIVNATNDKNVILNNVKFSIKMLLQELEIINKRRYSLLNLALSNEKFFKNLYYSSLELEQNYIIKKYEKRKVPICWYGKHLVDNIKSIEQKYIENDYKNLYDLLYEDEFSNLKELKKYWDLILTRNDEKLKLTAKFIDIKKLNLEHIQNSIIFDKIEKIIYSSKLEVYVRVDVSNHSENRPPIIIEDATQSNKKNEFDTLVSTIEEFINIFSENSIICDPNFKIKPYNLLILDIMDGKIENQIYDSILNYLEIIKSKIKLLYPEVKERERTQMIERIKDYILKSIFKLAFPKNPLKEDISFYRKTQLLDWVTPEHFSIKNIDFAQLTFAESLIKKFEDSKSLDEKINCIFNIHAYINNIFKFNTGKDTEIGQDELTPVLQYLIIKIQPRRIISNINYLKCFLNEEDLISKKGFLMSQIDSAVTFVSSINHNLLNLSEIEYNKNVEKSKHKNNIS